jgi:hypothetical protein
MWSGAIVVLQCFVSLMTLHLIVAQQCVSTLISVPTVTLQCVPKMGPVFLLWCARMIVVMRVVYIQGKTWLTDMVGPIRRSLLMLKRKDHLKLKKKDFIFYCQSYKYRCNQVTFYMEHPVCTCMTPVLLHSVCRLSSFNLLCFLVPTMFAVCFSFLHFLM